MWLWFSTQNTSVMFPFIRDPETDSVVCKKIEVRCPRAHVRRYKELNKKWLMKEKEVSQGCKCDEKKRADKYKVCYCGNTHTHIYRKNGNFDEWSINVHEKHFLKILICSIIVDM